MKEKIENFIKENGFNLDLIASNFGISKDEVLKNLPSSVGVRVDGDKFDEIIANIENWGDVLIVKATPFFIFEIKSKISKGSYARGYYNFSTQNAPLGGHLKADEIAHIAFLSTVITMNMLSHAVAFYDKNGDEIFKIYVARDEKREFIKEQVEAFENLKALYL